MPRGDTSCQLSRPETEHVQRTTDGPLSVFWTFHIARKRLADFIELRGFLRFHERSDIFVRGYSTWKVDPFLFLFLSSLSYLFSTKEISKMWRRKRTSMRKTYSKFYGVHRWREKFKVEEDRYRFTFFLDREETKWLDVIYILLLEGNRRFILRLDKKIKNLILIIFRSLRFLFSVLSVFCGQVCMIYDSP